MSPAALSCHPGVTEPCSGDSRALLPPPRGCSHISHVTAAPRSLATPVPLTAGLTCQRGGKRAQQEGEKRRRKREQEGQERRKRERGRGEESAVSAEEQSGPKSPCQRLPMSSSTSSSTLPSGLAVLTTFPDVLFIPEIVSAW